MYTNTSINIFGALINKYYGIPNIWHFREFRHEDHGIYYFLGDKNLMHLANKYASKIIVISQSMKQFHIQKGINSKLIKVVYNDVSKSSYIERDWNNEADELNILIAGDIKEGKCQLEVIKSLMMVQDNISWNLYLAGTFGNSTYCKTVKKYIEANDLDEKVHILGLVEDMNELRKKCNVGVVASKKEAFGRVTIEGMLAGLAMIGSNTGGTVELIKNKDNGLLYQIGNNKDLAECIKALSDRKFRVYLSKNGQKYAIENFTVGNCYKTIVQEIMFFRRK